MYKDSTEYASIGTAYIKTDFPRGFYYAIVYLIYVDVRITCDIKKLVAHNYVMCL